ncbi:MAG: hypothetical protein RQ745_12830, partial [Longimicrobiales bacterium]|nr:hypothetical protein [Longimicrobiales bacterium]
AFGTLPVDEAVNLFGSSPPPPPKHLRRWVHLNVDPDGYVWIELWERDGTEGVPVLLINPASGAVTRHRVPAFPLRR